MIRKEGLGAPFSSAVLLARNFILLFGKWYLLFYLVCVSNFHHLIASEADPNAYKVKEANMHSSTLIVHVALLYQPC